MTESSDRRTDIRIATLGGVASAVIGFGGMAIVGTVSPVEARRLLECVQPTVRFAASSYIAGGATILALMLTLLTFSITHDLEFRASHYRRIRDTALMTSLVTVDDGPKDSSADSPADSPHDPDQASERMPERAVVTRA